MDGYILVLNGVVQHIEAGGLRGMVVAPSYGAAKRFAKRRAGVSVAALGSAQGETLEGHIEASREKGANGLFYTDDGENLVYFVFKDMAP